MKKRCTKCGLRKLAGSFYKVYGKPRSWCKLCDNAQAAKNRKERVKKGLCAICCKENSTILRYCENCAGRHKSKMRNHHSKAEVKKRHAIATAAYHKRIKIEAFEAYGGCVCACCNEGRLEFLSIDHINNDGASHRKVIKGAIYGWLKKNSYPDGFRVLCLNCNGSLGFHGYCPHDKEKSNESP